LAWIAYKKKNKTKNPVPIKEHVMISKGIFNESGIHCQSLLGHLRKHTSSFTNIYLILLIFMQHPSFTAFQRPFL